MSKYLDSLSQFYIIKVVEIIIYVLLIIILIYLDSLIKNIDLWCQKYIQYSK